MLMLTRNSDLYDAISSVKAIQDRFNSRYRYPWVFLNEVAFSDEFQQRMRDIILGPAPPEGRSREEEQLVEFGLIPHDHWFQPDWIDESKASAGRWNLVFKGIIYGGEPLFLSIKAIK
jgi:alpha 1,2-mannosyltransferase